MNQPQLLTPAQLAEQWQVPLKTIYNLVSKGKLKAKRLPGSRLLRFDPNDLEPAQPATLVQFSKIMKAA